jgi:hypothetical protein
MEITPAQRIKDAIIYGEGADLAALDPAPAKRIINPDLHGRARSDLQMRGQRAIAIRRITQDGGAASRPVSAGEELALGVKGEDTHPLLDELTAICPAHQATPSGDGVVGPGVEDIAAEHDFS